MNKIRSFIRFHLFSVSLREKLLFVRNLAIAVKSGMSLIAGLELIKAQTQSKTMSKILVALMADVQKGMFLSKGMENYPSAFDNLFVNVVKVGETSGTLHENLNYLATELMKKDAFRKKIRGAMVYPIVVFIATIAVSVLLLVFLLPRLMPVFANLKTELPLPTRMLIAMSNGLISYGPLVALGVFVLIVLIWAILKINKVKYVIHYSYFFWPIVRRIVVQTNMANISRTMGILLKSGVKIVETLQITAKILENRVYRTELEDAAIQVQKGEYFYKHLEKRRRVFPPTFYGLVAVGENTGNLIENLEYLNEFYEKDVDDFMKNVSTLLEPLLLLILGVTVGFIALATILPIFQITKGI